MIIYKRHRESCPLRSQIEHVIHLDGDLFVKKGAGKCSCVLWGYGSVGRQEIRESLKLRDWTKAQKLVAERLNRGRWQEPAAAAPPPQDDRITIADAASRYVTNAEAQGSTRRRSKNTSDCSRGSRPSPRTEELHISMGSTSTSSAPSDRLGNSARGRK